MTGIADRLNAAADRLEALDRAGTEGPWSAGASWAGGLAVLGPIGQPITVVSTSPDPDDTAKCDADLIAVLRGMAPVIVKHLRDEADRFRDDTKQEEHYPRWHDEDAPGCGRDIEPVDGSDRCTCWDSALALADAIRAGAS